MRPRVSVEISTFNRKDVLQRVLERLADQTYPPSDFEVVVSDGGSTDGLVNMVRRLSPSLPYAVQILDHDRISVGENHNRGIRACRGSLVIMLAADIFAEPDLIEQFVASHDENPDPKVVVSGQIRQATGLPDTVFQQSFDILLDRLFDDQLKGLHVPHFWISNISFKKDFMLKHGMFYDWTYASGEDIELGYRLRSQGMRLIKNSKAIGHHYHEVTIEGIAQRSYLTGYHRNILEEYIPDDDFRQKIGKAPQKGMQRVTALLKRGVRNCCENRMTVSTVIVPMMHLAERVRSFAPLVPILCQRMTSYYIRRGMRDFRNGVSIDPYTAKFYTTDPD